MAAWGTPESRRGSADGSRSSMSSHIPSGMTGLPSVLQGMLCHRDAVALVCSWTVQCGTCRFVGLGLFLTFA